tara:strand:- start:38 stop:223 length:186 start_codon:yes stop_codon:yes gene_type:complete
MFAIERTWMVSADTNFLGYEYAMDETQVISKSIVKYGAPEKWSVDQYTITKIKWAEEGELR